MWNNGQMERDIYQMMALLVMTQQVLLLLTNIDQHKKSSSAGFQEIADQRTNRFLSHSPVTWNITQGCTVQRKGQPGKWNLLKVQHMFLCVLTCCQQLYIWAIWKSGSLVEATTFQKAVSGLTPLCWSGRCCPVEGWVGAYRIPYFDARIGGQPFIIVISYQIMMIIKEAHIVPILGKTIHEIVSLLSAQKYY